MKFWLYVILAISLQATPSWGWTPASPVRATPARSLGAKVAVDSNAKVHVVWQEQEDGSHDQVWYSNNTSGSFSAPERVSQDVDISCMGSDIQVVGQDVHVAWETDLIQMPETDQGFEIYYRKKSAGAWGPFYNVSNTHDYKSLNPSIGVTSTVGPLIPWQEGLAAQWGADNYDVFYSEWNGAGFSGASNLSQTPGGAVYGSVSPRVVIAPNGDVTVVWPDRISGNYYMRAKRRVGGVWQAAQVLSAYDPGPTPPGVAVSPDGQVHVAYAAGGQIYYQKWNGSAWTAASPIPNPPANLIRAQIAADAQGHAHVVADNTIYGVGDVWYSTNSSGAWSPWTNISNTPNSSSYSPAIAYGGGLLAVVWHDNSNGAGGTTGNWEIYHTVQGVIPPGPTGTISGYVRDQNGFGISGATVEAGVYQTASGALGSYSLTVPPGVYTVSASKLYYGPGAVPGQAVSANQTTTVNLAVQASAPDPLAQFYATPSSGLVRLNWTNPSSPNFTGALIRSSTSGYPAAPTSGSPVVDSPGAPSSTGSFTHSGLTNGVPVYYSAFAHDADGHFSAVSHAIATPHSPTIGEAKLLPDGALIDLAGKVVSAVFASDGAIYVQEPDRSAGIRVTGSTGVAVGDRVNVTGTLGTRILSSYPSERQITGSQVTVVSHNAGPVEMAVNSATLGGEAFGLYTPGVSDGLGLNNMGLLVSLTGRVTSRISSTLMVDDGGVPVMVRCPSIQIPVAVGDSVEVTGIVEGSIPGGEQENRRYVHIRSFADLVRLAP